ncbi:hypothetical protein LA080_002562 [Diaporthe eres]|nr:hypothetical protein LA080_002562 [Diaporthe eres]
MPEQKSQEGMFRSLLFQFLDKLEQRDAIEQELSQPTKKFWILIDGLDEFEGKHATIAAFLSRLERLANVKVLVSSRPLPLFACQSILEGLEEYDTLPELMNRVTQFPPELGDFFRQIIYGIDPRKRDQSARFLRLVFESQTSSSLNTIPTLGLAIVDEQGLRADFMGQSVTGLSNAERVLRCKTLEGRLRSRCFGLVEIQVDSGINLATPLEPITAAGGTIVNSRVMSLHRSLYEYLCTEGIWERDTLRVDNACGMFEPNAILASLWTQLAGLEITLWFYAALSADCYDNAVIHNVCASAANCPPEILATNLARLQGLFTRDKGFLRIWNCAPSRRPRKPERWKGCENLSSGLAIAAEFGMVSLVQLALEDPDEIRFKLRQPEAENGHDPNEDFEGNFDGKGGTITTPWIRWLSVIRDEGRTFPGWNSTHYETDFYAELAHRRAAFTKLFVDAGAELGTHGTHMQKLVDKKLPMLGRGLMTQHITHVIAKSQAGPGTLESLLSPVNRARSSSSAKP